VGGTTCPWLDCSTTNSRTSSSSSPVLTGPVLGKRQDILINSQLPSPPVIVEGMGRQLDRLLYLIVSNCEDESNLYGGKGGIDRNREET